MKKTKLLILASMLLVVALSVVPAAALIPAWEWTTTVKNYTNGAWSLGGEFTMNSNYNVGFLGFFDDYGDGLTESHDVGIYDLSATLLTSTTVTNADPLIGHFRWHSTAPVTLVAGQTYRIAAETGSENYTFEPFGFYTVSAVSLGPSREISSSVLAYPDITYNDIVGIFGPNMAPAPLPPTALMLGSGLLALGGWRRFRRS